MALRRGAKLFLWEAKVRLFLERGKWFATAAVHFHRSTFEPFPQAQVRT